MASCGAVCPPPDKPGWDPPGATKPYTTSDVSMSVASQNHEGPKLIGASPAIQRIRDLIRHVADTGLNILICGESGVGKEVVAQNLYRQSPRNGKPFLKINCAALPDGLLESELFGHEQGAFTGAERRKRGKFELANGGALLLDEIGDMSIALQAKLLHVLQSGEFSPLGSEKEVRTDTWVLAATNHELEQAIKEERFREDLYYRLNIIKILIPPLRDRPEDVAPLIEHFVNEYASQFTGGQFSRPTSRVISRLCEYHWPGNVRELQNILKRCFALGNWEETVEELLAGPASAAGAVAPAADGALAAPRIASFLPLGPDGVPDIHNLTLKNITRSVQEKVEREVIGYVLEKTGYNRSKASRLLKISYKALLYKIKDLHIHIPVKPSD
jgi:transcriptional regulator with PAS, ATPase and Fis domain